MGLEFNPPEWLIRDYMNRPNPVVEGLQGVNEVMKTYAQQKALQQQQALKEKQFGLLQNADARAQGTYAREYNPAELPGAGGAYNQFSPQDYGQVTSTAPTLTGDAQMRSMLTQEGGPATLGPSAGVSSQPSMVERWNQFKSSSPGIGMGQNTSLAPAPTNPQEQANLDLATKFPQGFEGAKVDASISRLNKPVDEKRTFQEKQEVYDSGGNAIGYRIFDTRTGEKSTLYYPNEGGIESGPKFKPSVPSAAVEKNVAGKGFIDLLDRIQQEYKPEYVGPIDARKRDIAQKYDAKAIGLPATSGASNFVRDLADLRSAVVNERTGAAVGERQEWDRLLELIPDDKKSDIDFLPKIQSMRSRYNQIITNREAGYRKAKYRNQQSSVLSPSGGPIEQMLQQKQGQSSSINSAPTGMEHMSDEELQRIINGG